jgi:mono/diheme cytochrome c family protein
VIAVKLLVSLAAASLLALLAEDVRAADPARGQSLYQNHCTVCHASGVHIRDRRRGKDEAAVRAQIERWQSHLGLRWREEDMDDVYAYLAARFYRFFER